MPRIFAIDWDRREVRGLLLQAGPTGTSISGAWVAPFDSGEGAAVTAQQIGARLATAMGTRTVGKATTLIAVGRDNVQMKLLSLPPAPADELPDMVRFQAEREFTALGSEAALDFIPLAGDAQTPHQVLAVALSPAGMTEAREICQLLDTEPEHVVLRSCAAAALVHRAGVIAADSVALVVNPLTDEADMIALAAGQVISMRTVRLPDPSQPDAHQRALAAEIRRTLAAVRQQLGERQVDRVVICGNAAAANQATAIGDELGLSVAVFDPVAHAPSGLASLGLPPASLARFSAVLGMALGAADRRPPVVDFLHVRQRPAVRQFGRVHVLAAAAAATILLALMYSLWWQAQLPVRELAQVQSELANLDDQVKQAEEMSAKAQTIERWLANDVTWLDGLVRVSERLRPKLLTDKDFPASDDLFANRLTFFRPPLSDPAAGRIDLRAVAKSDSAVSAFESRLRDPQHDVRAGVVRQHAGTPGYRREFDLYVGVAGQSEATAEAPQ